MSFLWISFFAQTQQHRWTMKHEIFVYLLKTVPGRSPARLVTRSWSISCDIRHETASGRARDLGDRFKVHHRSWEDVQTWPSLKLIKLHTLGSGLIRPRPFIGIPHRYTSFHFGTVPRVTSTLSRGVNNLVGRVPLLPFCLSVTHLCSLSKLLPRSQLWPSFRRDFPHNSHQFHRTSCSFQNFDITDPDPNVRFVVPAIAY